MESSWRNTDRQLENKVRFCVHYGNKPCKDCKTTAFHQIESDLTCYISEDSTKMIADIGCPNTVISEEDETIFVQNLSKFQQQHLKRVRTEENLNLVQVGLINAMKSSDFLSKVKVVQSSCGLKLLWSKQEYPCY